MSEADSIVFIIDDDAQVRASLTNLCRSDLSSLVADIENHSPQWLA